MKYDIEGFNCPWNVLANLCRKANPVLASAHSGNTALIFESNDRTLAVMLWSTIKSDSRRNTKRVVQTPIRIERWSLLQDEASLELFDTIRAATTKDRSSGEVMLEMLGTSMDEV